MKTDPQFVVAVPARSVCDDNARALHNVNRLRFLAMGTRKGTRGVPLTETRLNPAIGLATYIFAKSLPAYWAEYARFRLHPWFDSWVLKQLSPGDHIVSSYGYANACFRWIRARGGKTFVDGGNSHPQNFWEIISEEHQRWGCKYPPVGPHHYHRSLEMMADVDFVLSPSSFVTKSFLDRGFKPGQIIRNVYPLDLTCFTPAGMRPKDRPLTVINTGSLSLRKGTPYLLESFRIIRRAEPRARFLLTSDIADSARHILNEYDDLGIEWSPPLPHQQLADRLRSADVFVLPSLEDGFARTVAEALACGLPVITTPNTGASDLVRNGENGEVVPIRDATTIADAVLRWWGMLREAPERATSFDKSVLSFDAFQREFFAQLRERQFLPADAD
jgi:glycosyltransferase involved in cell wall biosynthesis